MLSNERETLATVLATRLDCQSSSEITSMRTQSGKHFAINVSQILKLFSEKIPKNKNTSLTESYDTILQEHEQNTLLGRMDTVHSKIALKFQNTYESTLLWVIGNGKRYETWKVSGRVIGTKWFKNNLLSIAMPFGIFPTTLSLL